MNLSGKVKSFVKIKVYDESNAMISIFAKGCCIVSGFFQNPGYISFSGSLYSNISLSAVDGSNAEKVPHIH